MFKTYSAGNQVNIEAIVLKTIATAGLLALVLCAPNALQVLKQFGFDKKRKKNPKYLINKAVQRLIRNGLVVTEKDGKSVSVTKKGQKTLAFLEAGMIKIKRKKWDGKWRLVIFDIKEKRRNSRRQLRFLLSQIGFVRLQDSVWIYPFESKELVTLIKLDNFLQKEVLYLTVEDIENDQELKKYFNL
ncbi:MAG: CRISPR-associated endonuclease Cas2 [bacterium]|nr:CRISPR-associated endonuclease Cas2 [bacterium]